MVYKILVKSQNFQFSHVKFHPNNKIELKYNYKGETNICDARYTITLKMLNCFKEKFLLDKKKKIYIIDDDISNVVRASKERGW